jgi:L-iditol 2-dehydrogenase
MRAAILHGKEQIRVETIEPRALEAGEVRVRIEAALTCGTDLKVFKRGYHAKMIIPPSVFGHELAGVISEVSPEACGWQVGERVVAANSAPCGTCFQCRNGRENLCDDLQFLNGAYAESIVVPARLAQKNLVQLKAGTSFRDAALVEPLACVVQGLEDTRLRAGQRLLVIGAGPIGLMFVALGRHLGCSVAVAGRGERRLQTARRLGAEQVFRVAPGMSLPAAIPQGTVFDTVIEAVGKPETWEEAVRFASKGGTVNFFGGCPANTSVTFDTSLLHYSNLTLVASFHHTPRSVRQALEYVESGVIRSSDFVDGECPLTDLPELFQSMAAGNRAVKTLIRVRE